MLTFFLSCAHEIAAAVKCVLITFFFFQENTEFFHNRDAESKLFNGAFFTCGADKTDSEI